MTLAQRMPFAHGATPSARMILAFAGAALLLLAAMGLLVVLSAHTHPAQATIVSATTSRSKPSPLAKADEPACAAALAKARDTRGLSAPAAIAASTAMLRACDVH